jgi:hypothetical protein
MVKHGQGAASSKVSRTWNNLKDRASYAAARAGAAITVAFVGTRSANAQTGWGTAITNGISLSQNLAQLVVWIGFVAGLSAVGYAGWNLWKKGDERHGADVKIAHIVWPFLGGAVLMALSYFGLLSVETMGGSSANIHNTSF